MILEGITLKSGQLIFCSVFLSIGCWSGTKLTNKIITAPLSPTKKEA